MLHDDSVRNAILHRSNSKINRMKITPFLVPLNDSTSTFSNFATPSSKDKSSASRKSYRALRPDTIKRAANDACMAAAIGDLEWLKQTLKISNEKAYDKDGFATIHLASIHGRINIIRYLIEEQNFEPDFPSAIHCWYPVHLCISNQIGSRAVECLKYLIEKGADINVKNADDIYPLHMAASEGQVDCLKLLLQLKPDANVTDKRGQTPLDLAKLWGHRMCAKVLSSYMWNQEKKGQLKEKRMEDRLKTQEILKEIERAHLSHFSDLEESEKQFDKFLMNQGFSPEENKIEESKPKEKKEYNLGLKNILLIPDDEQEKETNNIFSQLDIRSSDITSIITSSRKTQPKNLKPTPEIKRAYHEKEWNYSTKPSGKIYVSNLKDFFPRDPYTLLPSNGDLLLINKELKGMSLEKVKEFMKTNLKRNKSSSFVHPKNNSSRPVYYRPKNIIDTQGKVRSEDQQLGIDNVGLFLGDDIDSFGFRKAQDYIYNNLEIFFSANSNNCDGYEWKVKKKISPDNDKKIIDDKLEIIENNYGPELAKFMMDKRSGKISQKYEKVFIT